MLFFWRLKPASLNHGGTREKMSLEGLKLWTSRIWSSFLVWLQPHRPPGDPEPPPTSAERLSVSMCSKEDSLELSYRNWPRAQHIFGRRCDFIKVCWQATTWLWDTEAQWGKALHRSAKIKSVWIMNKIINSNKTGGRERFTSTLRKLWNCMRLHRRHRSYMHDVRRISVHKNAKQLSRHVYRIITHRKHRKKH